MPPLAADLNLWRFERPHGLRWAKPAIRALEWELRSGALTSVPSGRMDNSTYKTSEGNRTGPGPSGFLRSKAASRASAARTPPGQDIALERTKTFGASAPVARPTKNWSPDTIRGSRLHFEWIVSGLTAVSFWTARRRLIAALEGPARFRPAGRGFALTRLSPNRCLAGLPSAPSGASPELPD
jgi:hypothetical protein